LDPARAITMRASTAPQRNHHVGQDAVTYKASVTSMMDWKLVLVSSARAGVIA